MDEVDATPGGDDPFWGVVRRRHPEARIVLLPPQPPGPDSADPMSLAQADRFGTKIDELFDELWHAVFGTSPPTTVVRWEAGISSHTGTPVRSGRHEEPDEEQAAARVAAADASLRARAWRVAPSAGPLHRVVAVHDGITVAVSRRDATCRMEVRGPEVAVGREALRTLRRGPRSE